MGSASLRKVKTKRIKKGSDKPRLEARKEMEIIYVTPLRNPK